VGNLSEVDQLDTKLKRVESASLFATPYTRKLPILFRAMYGAMSLVPRFRNMIRLCRYQF